MRDQEYWAEIDRLAAESAPYLKEKMSIHGDSDLFRSNYLDYEVRRSAARAGNGAPCDDPDHLASVTERYRAYLNA